MFGRYENSVPGWPKRWYEVAYLKRNVLEIDISESPNSAFRSKIKNLEKVIVDKNDKQKVDEIKTPVKYVLEGSAQLGFAVFAVIVRGFYIVDVLINLFSKINVKVTPMI